MPRMAHAERLRIGRCSEQGRIYHLTLACWNRQSHFNDLPTGRCPIFGMQALAQQAQTLCFVIMPDHMHWLLQLTDHAELSFVVQKMKSISTKIWHQVSGTNECLWQKGFYDRASRHDADLLSVARYIVANPLRAGLVMDIRRYALWDCVWL